MSEADDQVTPPVAHFVCFNNKAIDIVGYLIEECKCDPMCRESNGITPLHEVCAGGNIKIYS